MKREAQFHQVTNLMEVCLVKEKKKKRKLDNTNAQSVLITVTILKKKQKIINQRLKLNFMRSITCNEDITPFANELNLPATLVTP